jgi:hypothetical protein
MYIIDQRFMGPNTSINFKNIAKPLEMEKKISS